MSFRYFAYGSNLWPPQMRSRCPTAMTVGRAALDGWATVYDKPSTDGSAKLNIRPDPDAFVEGVVYEVEEGDRQALDAAEPRYTPIFVDLDGQRTLTYVYQGEPVADPPFDWYTATALLGAGHHGLDARALDVEPAPDPLAPGVRPVESEEELPHLQDILSVGLSVGGDRYYIHPGDVAWWVHHDDPRHPDHFSVWIQDESAFAVIDTLKPQEINVFARPGADRMPLIRWAQRRLHDEGEVGWVADTDTEMIDALEADAYEPVFAYRVYEWDLTGVVPDPHPGEGWELRPVAGEAEADARRAAAHGAFESTMDPQMHLRRYVDFMRSPVYVAERDLVAARSDGVIASFMIWWADESGIAEIEPFGTHPDFHRQGLGRALLYHGLAEMKSAGMTLARVCTDDDRPATGFYEACGFADVGRLRWWRKT